MGEEGWIGAAEPAQPISGAPSPMAKPLKLATSPADQKGIDPRQGGTQLRVIKVAIIVDPAADARIVHCSQVLQGLVAAMMKRPAPDCPAHGFQRRRTRCGHEAVRVDMRLPDRLSCSECEPEKVKRLVREVAAPVCILAVDDLRLLGMQDQLAGRKAICKRAP
jgi:hypothetical protein